MGTNHLLFGRNVFEEAIGEKVKILEVFVENASAERWAQDLLGKSQVRVSIQMQIPSAIRQHSHQGIAFKCQHDFYAPPSHLNFSKLSRVLLCNHLTDIQNFGTLVRSAVAFGVDLIVHEDKRSVELTPAAVKASAGQAFKTRFLKVSSMGSMVADLKREGIEVLALSCDAEESIYSWKGADRWAVVVGSEEAGVQKSVLEEADRVLLIPMKRGVESLNVAQAGGIFLSWAFSQKDSR